MTLTDADVIKAVEAYTWLNVQTSAQANASTNTTASLLYNSQSRQQGNFSLFYALAAEQVTIDSTRYGLTLTDLQKTRAYAYLIQHYFESKFKDWQASKRASGGDSVERDKNQTSGMTAYTSLMMSYKAGADNSISVTTTLEKHTDSENYLDVWKDSQMDIDEIDQEDPA